MEAYLRRTVEWYGGVGLLTKQVFRSLALPPKYFRLIVQEIEAMGVRSLGVAMTAAIFTGMVFTIQSAVNMGRFGAESYVGPVAALAILRELGPVLTAILVGGKVASGITAELGSMKVTEQIDAMRALGTDPIQKLVTPRVIATCIVLPLLTAISDFVGIFGGYVVATLLADVNGRRYWTTAWQALHWNDLGQGLLKPFVFAFIISLVGCYYGLRASGGTQGVGRATTQAMVMASVLIFVITFFLTRIFTSFADS